MRRITLWSLSTITTVVLLFSYHTSTSSLAGTSVAAGTGGDLAANGSTPPDGSGSTPSGTGTTPSGTSSAPGTATPSSSGSSSSTPSPGAAKAFTGAASDTSYGPVQVRITVVGGKVTKSAVTQVPWNDGRDQEINGYAVPILNQEAVQSQSASIDMVSGATFTSNGYIESLQSALDKAHL